MLSISFRDASRYSHDLTNQSDFLCPSTVYSFFAFAEYVVIYTNIIFHGTAILDFGDQSLTTAVTSIATSHGYSFVENESYAADESAS